MKVHTFDNGLMVEKQENKTLEIAYQSALIARLNYLFIQTGS